MSSTKFNEFDKKTSITVKSGDIRNFLLLNHIRTGSSKNLITHAICSNRKKLNRLGKMDTVPILKIYIQ